MSWQTITSTAMALALAALFVLYVATVVARERRTPAGTVTTWAATRPWRGAVIGAVVIVTALLVVLRLGALS